MAAPEMTTAVLKVLKEVMWMCGNIMVGCMHSYAGGEVWSPPASGATAVFPDFPSRIFKPLNASQISPVAHSNRSTRPRFHQPHTEPPNAPQISPVAYNNRLTRPRFYQPHTQAT